MWKKLYTSYVRPLLEFAIPVWNPYLKGDIDILERAIEQRKYPQVSKIKPTNFLHQFKNFKNLPIV